MPSVVMGVGAYVPARVMVNKDFEALVETSDEWIVERTGIRKRHIAAEDELTSDLGAKAAAAALKHAGLAASDIDLVIVATTTPDETMPSTATRVQGKLGIQGAAFDISAACSGFVYALSVADAMLAAGQGRRALVIGAETYSRIVDWKDRATCILFGDGAGAVVLEAASKAEAGTRGVLYSKIVSDGAYGDLLCTTGGVSKTKNAGVIAMSGREVFRHAVAHMSECVVTGLAAVGESVSSLHWLVPHQANARILAAVAQKLGVGEEKVISTVAIHANTSAASIPLALAAGVADGRVKPGQLVALTALGAGFTWGACILRW